jgi:hypothetical protein
VPQGVDLGITVIACKATKDLDVINYSSHPLTLYTSLSPDIGYTLTRYHYCATNNSGQGFFNTA